MIFRTESNSAGDTGVPAGTIVKTAAKAIAAAFAGLLGRTRRRTADILTLSDYELRDIGCLEHGPQHHRPGDPIAYDLLDLMPRGIFLGHRNQR